MHFIQNWYFAFTYKWKCNFGIFPQFIDNNIYIGSAVVEDREGYQDINLYGGYYGIVLNDVL